MPDYKAMYLKLFNAATDAISTLQTAQIGAEEMYVEHEPNVTLFNPNDSGNETP